MGYVLTRPTRLTFDDERVYVAVAQNIFRGLGPVQAPGDREASKMPGYPLLLAALGPEAGSPAFIRRARVVQGLFGCATVWLIWVLARRLFGARAALWAAWIAALEPFHVYYTGLLLSETVFTTVFVGAFLVLDGGVYGGGWTRRTGWTTWTERMDAAPDRVGGRAALWGAASGALFGGATLLRASALPVLPFCSVLLFATVRRPGAGAAVRVRAAALVGAVLFMGLALWPWIARNWRKFGAFVPTTLQTGESLYEACSPYADGGPGWEKVPWEQESGGRRMSELENDRFWRTKAVEWIRRHPGDFLRLAAVKFARTWSPVPNAPGFRTPFYVALAIVGYVPVMGAALAGLVLARRHWRRWLVMIGPVLYYALLHTVFVGSIRYRAPAMAFLMPFAGRALCRLFGGRTPSPSR